MCGSKPNGTVYPSINFKFQIKVGVRVMRLQESLYGY